MSQPDNTKTSLSDNPPPQAMETEKNLLAVAIVHGLDAVEVVISSLKPEMFYVTAHGKIWAKIQDMAAQNKPVDIVSLSEELKGHGISPDGPELILAELAENIAIHSMNDENIKGWANIIKKKSDLRKIIISCYRTTQECVSEIAEPQQIIENVGQSFDDLDVNSDKIQAETMIEIGQRSLEALEYSITHGKLLGVPTGFKSLNYILGGFHDTDLIILAGQTSMGKTSLEISLVLHQAKQGIPVLIISPEMSRLQLYQRLQAIESGIMLTKITNGRVTGGGNEHKAIIAATAKISKLPIYIIDTATMKMPAIVSMCRYYHRRHGVKAIYLDHLGIVEGQGNSQRNDFIGTVSRTCKIIAKDLNIPFIALCQLNRGLSHRKIDERRPVLSDLRDSGNIEQDADVVLFVYREYVHTGNEENYDAAEFIVAKQRNGPTGFVEAEWCADTVHFCDTIQGEVDEMGEIEPELGDF